MVAYCQSKGSSSINRTPLFLHMITVYEMNIIPSRIRLKTSSCDHKSGWYLNSSFSQPETAFIFYILCIQSESSSHMNLCEFFLTAEAVLFLFRCSNTRGCAVLRQKIKRQSFSYLSSLVGLDENFNATLLFLPFFFFFFLQNKQIK